MASSLAYGHAPVRNINNEEKPMNANNHETENGKSTNRSILLLAGLAMMVTLGRMLGSNITERYRVW
jgi:hypothetical protein